MNCVHLCVHTQLYLPLCDCDGDENGAAMCYVLCVILLKEAKQ